MPTLATTVDGLKLPNPFIIGSGPPGTNLSVIQRAFREGWAWTQREWMKATRDTGVGNPQAAMPEKGKRYFEAVTKKIAGFLVELAKADVRDLYE